MNLTELTTPLAASYPVSELVDHLHLGTGFADDGSQDAVLEAYLRAAVATIEARTGKVLLEKDFSWEITRWYSSNRQGLPVAPVSVVASVTLVSFDGSETVVDDEKYNLREDNFRPEVVAGCLPTVPTNGTVRIEFTAGFGPDWSDVPQDMAQAVLMLAAHYYQNRGGCADADGTIPMGVQALLERYRTVRILGDRL